VRSGLVESSTTFEIDGRIGPVWIVNEVERLAPLVDRRPAAIRARTEEALFSAGKPRDYRQRAVVETDLEQAKIDAILSGPVVPRHEACKIVEYGAQRVVVEAKLERPGLVILADMFYPGWELTIDDGETVRRADILRTNRVMRGALLPAGAYRLEYRYRPRSFLIGAWISGLAWPIAIACCLWRRRARITR
jgi:hypothetical protein